MYTVVISKKWHFVIHDFIIRYKNFFLDTFTDTWIFSEDIIRNEYIKKSIIFKDNIYNKINDILSYEKVFWYSLLDNWNLETTFIVWNYRLFVEYREDSKNFLRTVENIRFFNK